VTDVDGNTFLDLTAAFGVMAVGHSNPRVSQAIADQAAKLIHGMGDVHPSALKVELARKVARHAPGDLGHAVFGQNGGDAVEAAVKTARLFTGKSGVVGFRGGYHGLTYGALAVTHRDDFRAPFAGQVPAFARHVPYAEPRSCPVPCCGGAACTTACLGFVEEAISDAANDVGAVIVEPIQGRGGIVEPPPGWLSGLRALCDRLGRAADRGRDFYRLGPNRGLVRLRARKRFARHFVRGQGDGRRLSHLACLARPHVMAAWGASKGEALHTSTFLGSPLGCAAALAAIAEMEERDCPLVRVSSARTSRNV
jgi:4-aminobutyrate aminotransferase-like enzyme